MNTNEAAKLLGVSPKTVLRWITQLSLEIERTPLKHYRFSEEDVALLHKVQEQLKNGTPLQNMKIHEKKVRKAKAANKPPKDESKMYDKLVERIEHLERKLSTKADDVVSYQILQHRNEIEELQSVVCELTQQIETLQTKLEVASQADCFLAFDEAASTEKSKKKPFFSTLFRSSKKEAQTN